MIDLDLLDEQLEHALTDDVRALRGAPPVRTWSEPPPATLLPSRPVDVVHGFDDWDDEDEWAPTAEPIEPSQPAEPSARQPQERSKPSKPSKRANPARPPSRPSAAAAPAPPAPARPEPPRPLRAAARPAAGVEAERPEPAPAARPASPKQTRKAPPRPVRATATVHSSPDLLAAEPEPEPDELLTAEEVFGTAARREPEIPARPRPAMAQPSRPRSPFAGAGVGWEKTEAERKAATAKRARRAVNRPGLPIPPRPGADSQAAETPAAPDPRDVARARLREAVAALSAKEIAPPAPSEDRVEPQHAAQWAAMSEQFKPQVEPPPRLSIWRGR